MNYLTDKNTRGYSQEQLKELNTRLEKRMEKFDPESPFYKSELEWQADQLLIDYWQGRLEEKVTNVKQFPDYEKVKDVFFNGHNPFYLTEKGKQELWEKLCIPENWELYIYTDIYGHYHIDWYELDGWDAESAFCHMFDC